ncbi:MAG: AbrB/MazE/SpoVT family DNA-binding domain-containing protein [Candidatus Aenigmarchaeota archaeon]|nr:AbrB/MazE/SpoVT family DNA-binding domain-containing protein [Candidatus Aenigmarchaeota archaeon]
MQVKRELGKKGQVVIPKDIRTHLGLQQGGEVLFEVRGNEVVLRAPQEGEAFVEDFCNTGKKLKASVNIKRLIEEEYEVP